MHTHNEQVNKVPTVNSISDTQWNNIQDNTSRNQIKVNDEQKDSPNKLPLHSNHEEPNENTATCTRNGRIIKRQDRLTYN